MSLEQRYGFEVYPKRDVTLVRGRGALVWDDQGNRYIDCAAGIGVANVGHANPVVTRAIKRQADRLVSCPGIFYNDIRGELMEKLVSISPAGLNRVFLCNSGTEAVEAALKFARITTGKTGFISAMRGFHGRTMGALSATFRYRDEFEPLLPGHRFVPFNNVEKLIRAIDDETAAILLEIVQGEGGVRLADNRYLRSVREICDSRGILLIVDEVQTGFARTGKMFACEHSGVQPDIMTLAKAIAGGFPMGAVLCSDRISPALSKHGSTFGGNPLACAAALATIGFIEDRALMEQARLKGGHLVNQLEAGDLPGVREIRNLGLMVGIELESRARPVIENLLQNRVLALPAGRAVVRLLPPLVITREQLSEVAGRIHQALTDSVLR